ncbi:MAG: hypothetical protein V1799_12295 [bacterium]
MLEKRNIPLIIGLDFGTACTKAVVQAPYVVGQKKWAVYFGKYGHKTNCFLLPASIWISKEGDCSLKVNDSWSRFSSSKECLLEDPQLFVNPTSGDFRSLEARILAIAYNALTIAYIRNWFELEHGREFSSSHIQWRLNIGVPSQIYKHEVLDPLFKQIGIVAWKLSEKEQPVNINDIEPLLNQAGDITFESEILRENINTIPEVIAEFLGYANSDKRQDGMHVIVDIGANTLDVCAFNLFRKDGQDQFPFFTAIVTLNGALRLQEYRRKLLLDCFVSNLKSDAHWNDPMAPVHNRIEEMFPKEKIYKIVEDLCDKGDETFLNECRLSFTRSIDRMVRLNSESRDWKRGIPCHFCGGGSQLNFYHTVLLKVVNDYLHGNYKDRSPFRYEPLQKPDELIARNLPMNDYHRLAVAYGLSFHYRDLGQIIPAPQIVIYKHKESAIDLITYYDDRYISKEMT